ncbi:cyclase family protein [Streptomyces sp. NPDC059398]|uniref:cyclase family protein n=1 Tax=Streptomyces sp. NPDC059398 TaxID=3346820 RepID=UPI0036CB9983
MFDTEDTEDTRDRTAYTFKETGRKLSNWGRWGDDDERGTLNFVTPDTVKQAFEAVRTGERYELSIPVGDSGPQTGWMRRINPVHTMTVTPHDFTAAEGLVISDDFIAMPLQSGTQLDGLTHVGYDGAFYNGVPADAVTPARGATRNAIDATLPGFAGRGVLLDVAALDGGAWLEPGRAITVADLENAEKAAGTRLGRGDALLVRTGWVHKGLTEGWEKWLDAEPGLAPECAAWIHDRELAMVAADNWGVEVQPTTGGLIPLHAVLIRDMGMMLGEMWNLDALAAACRADHTWDFFLTATALRITGGVGSPVSPVAIR